MAATVQLVVGTLQFGQDTGNGVLAGADQVTLTTLIDGTAAVTVQLEPEAALTVARALASAGGALIGGRVDDTGKRLGLRAYLTTLARKES
jgi:hypothetical protein